MNKQLHQIAWLLAILVGLSLQASAQVANGIYATTEGFFIRYVDKDAKTVEIAPAQNPQDRIKEGIYYKDVVIPETLEVLDGDSKISCTVVAVGKSAFAMGEAYTVQYPKSCKEIKDRAYHMASLKEIVIPDWIETVGDMVFMNTKDVTKIEIGKGLKKVGERIFEGCNNIASIKVAPENSLFASKDDILYNKEMTQLIRCATDARDAEGHRVESVAVPTTVKVIAANAFNQCIYLKHITLNEGLETIGSDAFYRCDYLEEMNIPSTVSQIGIGAFVKLIKCQKFTVAEGNETFATMTDGTNEGKLLVNKKTNTLLAALYKTAPNVVIPDGIVEIAPRAFQSSEWAQTITIPASVEKLGYSAFADMYSLTEIEIPEKVTEIPAYCISGCKKLTQITLGKNVNLIGYGAFSGNETMEKSGGLLRVHATTPPAMAKDSDGDVYDWKDFAKVVTLEVPEGCVSKYKKDKYWRFFRQVYTVGNELVQPQAMLQLSVTPGMLAISAPVAAPIAVYAADGEAIYMTTARDCQIELPAGLYIVTYGSESHKVQVL